MALDVLHPQRLLALLGILVLFWLALPPKPRRVLATAHWGPWQRAMARAGHRPVRLRKLRFWLLVAAYAAAVLAWAGLRAGGREGPTRLEIVWDGSASMEARTADGGTRFGRATDAVEAVWRGLPGHVEIAMVLAGERQVLVTGRGGELPAVAPWQHPPAGRGVALAAGPIASDAGTAGAGAAGAGADTQRWTITDGQRGYPDSGGLLLVGGPSDNASLVVRGVDAPWPLPSAAIHVSLQHHSGGPLRGRLEVRGVGEVDGNPPEIELEAGGRRDVTLSFVRPAAGAELEVRWVCATDALAADDRVAWSLAPLPQPDIAVLAEAEAEGWVQLAAQALAEGSGGRVVEPMSGEPVSFLLVEGGRVDTSQIPRALLFGVLPPGQSMPQPWIEPALRDWRREHGLTVGLDLSELRVDQAWPGAVPPDAEVLVWAEEGPLLGLRRTASGAFLHAAFRLGDSNLPLLAAFPQLLRRAYAAAWGVQDQPPVRGHGVDAAESVLVQASGSDRPLQPFGDPPVELGPWLLALAAALVAARVYA